MRQNNESHFINVQIILLALYSISTAPVFFVHVVRKPGKLVSESSIINRSSRDVLSTGGMPLVINTFKLPGKIAIRMESLESLESWKAGKPGKLESHWKARKPESWKAGKPGKLESWKARKLERERSEAKGC